MRASTVPGYEANVDPVRRPASKCDVSEVTELAAFRALAPKWTLSTTQRYWSRYFTPQFFDRIAALAREYGIPEK